MPTYVAMKLVDASGIYAQIVPVIAGSIAHIDVHLDQLIGTCIEPRFQVPGVRCQERQTKKLKPGTLKLGIFWLLLKAQCPSLSPAFPPKF
jgi:hypothetical protein